MRIEREVGGKRNKERDERKVERGEEINILVCINFPCVSVIYTFLRTYNLGS